MEAVQILMSVFEFYQCFGKREKDGATDISRLRNRVDRVSWN